jgi:hypothetical protein
MILAEGIASLLAPMIASEIARASEGAGSDSSRLLFVFARYQSFQVALAPTLGKDVASTQCVNVLDIRCCALLTGQNPSLKNMHMITSMIQW